MKLWSIPFFPGAFQVLTKLGRTQSGSTAHRRLTKAVTNITPVLQNGGLCIPERPDALRLSRWRNHPAEPDTHRDN
jgi:hypothetical protein